MKTSLCSLMCCLIWLMSVAVVQADQSSIYELRIYHCNSGKMAELESRFRDHTVELFQKHGMTNIAYFRPTDDSDERLIYVLEFPSLEARTKSWNDFRNDPDWKAAYQKSTENGKLVASIESFLMKTTDFSPSLKLTPTLSEGSRVFELRDYTATEGNLSNLHARFRDHTVALFETHGIHNVAYFQLLDDQPGADVRLIYFVTHPSQEQAKQSFRQFGQDPAWQSAKKASEDNAGGSLTIKGGVKSTFLRPVDFSPLK